MRYWTDIPEAVAARLKEIASLLSECRETFFETADQFHWTPAPNSIASEAESALPSPDPILVSPEGETGHRLIAEVVQTFLLTASGHLGGLAALYGVGEVMFSSAMLVRGVVENCAHAMWVLGDDPQEPHEQRLARAYLEELLSAEEAKKNAGRMGGKGNPVYQGAAADYVRIRDEIISRFPEATRESLGERTLAGQALLGPEATVSWMFRLVSARGGSSIDDRAALGIYGFLSNLTHPTLYPVRQMREFTQSEAHPGEVVSQLHLDLDFQTRQASSAVVTFYQAHAFLTSYFGWPSTIHDQLTERIDEILPGTFNA